MPAQINRWNDVDKAAYLAISLRGLLPLYSRTWPQINIRTMLHSLLLFSPGLVQLNCKFNRVRLKARTRRREETLPELAEDIEQLVRLAYLEAAESMVEVLVKDQFVDSLDPRERYVTMHMTASPSHTESCPGNSTGTGILPACKQADNKVCEGDPAGEGAAGAVCLKLWGDGGSWRCSSVPYSSKFPWFKIFMKLLKFTWM